MKTRVSPGTLSGALLWFLIIHAGAVQTDIAGPAGSEQFGQIVKVLPNGNFVVTDPNYDAPGPVADVGRVYLYDGKTLAIINTMTGTIAGEGIGSGSFPPVFVLPNGDYLVCSSNWNGGRGAVTRCSSTTGCPSVINSSNSLVGAVAGDFVGRDGVVVLPNGSFVVRSSQWNNGAATTVGALTWFAAAATPTGTVTTANSRYGTTSGDQIGLINVIVLSNGNYVTQDVFWDNGGIADAGAVTFCSGTAPCTSAVSVSNSLIGTTANEYTGNHGVFPLTNGNYVVANGDWDNGGTSNVGAATFCSGATGCHATVGPANSLIGTTAEDHVALNGIAVLTNGNYVVRSTSWNNLGATAAGAATFCNGTSGCVGMTVSGSNSLVGSTANDNVGSTTPLTNGNYVVNTPTWDNPAGSPLMTDYGASTFCSGTSGCVGAVGAGNSLIGHRFGDGVGLAVALTNGNYVVASVQWTDNGFVSAVGAVTWCNGSTGCSGQVTSANSLTGSSTNDHVGNVTALTNGNYIVTSGGWDDGGTTDVGAATFCSGTSGCIGVVSPANSLIGSVTGDQVGSFSGGLALANGNYVVVSNHWKNGAATAAGALTPCSGVSGCTGTVSAANSLVGSTSNDFLGSTSFGDLKALANGDYVLHSSAWDNSGLVDAGAVTIGYRNGSTVGPITASNSVRGMIADFGFAMNYSYDSTNSQIVVGRPYENIVTVFGQAAPGSPLPLKITSITRLANGHAVLQGIGVANAVHTMERSLIPGGAGFSSLAPTTANGSGVIQFEDNTSTSLDKAFYRIAYP